MIFPFLCVRFEPHSCSHHVWKSSDLPVIFLTRPNWLTEPNFSTLFFPFFKFFIRSEAYKINREKDPQNRNAPQNSEDKTVCLCSVKLWFHKGNPEKVEMLQRCSIMRLYSPLAHNPSHSSQNSHFPLSKNGHFGQVSHPTRTFRYLPVLVEWELPGEGISNVAREKKDAEQASEWGRSGAWGENCSDKMR